MGRYDRLTPEEQARVIEIQDLLIDLYVGQKEAFEKGEKARAREIAAAIEGLRREKDNIEEGAAG